MCKHFKPAQSSPSKLAEFSRERYILRASAWETGADLEMKIGRFRLKLVHKVVMWTYVICQSFRFNEHFLAEFWISAPQGSPEADFQCDFGQFSISLLATYNWFQTRPKPYFQCTILRRLWVKILAHGNFSLARDCYNNLVLFEANGKQPEMACFSDRIFSMPMFYIVKS